MSETQADNRVVGPSFRRSDQRGLFVEIVNEGPWETVIHGSMAKDAVMGNHYHRRTDAFFYLVKGSAEIVIRHVADGRETQFTLAAGQGVFFHPYETHSIRYLEASDFIYLKSHRFRPESPDLVSAPVT